MAVDPLIELRDVNKYYGEPHVLQDINLTVGKGEVVVVIGPSGAGKSTLCGTVNRPETIHGTVFQSFNLSAHTTVLQKTSLVPVKVRTRGPGGRGPGVPPRLLRHWGWAAIARATARAMEPKASLFDDPTSPPDPPPAVPTSPAPSNRPTTPRCRRSRGAS
jgi:glutamate transport system ATP-binding protein